MVMLTLAEKRVRRHQQKTRWNQREKKPKPEQAEVPDTQECVQLPHEEQHALFEKENHQSSKWKNFQTWIGKWKKRIKEAEATDVRMGGSSTPERIRQSAKRE
ncbi:hypothetical protein I4I80_02560 [Pseudomonas syringae pv. tomato]|nr:hypothetical protein [Pseudomonas syringae pv. tomato]MBW8023625.1 hypothetical protein [Pseudomonas syringae pv. tomato]